MSLDADKQEFHGYVIQELVRCGTTRAQAESLASSSSYAELLETDPEYVMHRSAWYWADRIIGEDNLR